MWNRFASEEPALVEQPGVLGMELLERVVRQHGGSAALGDGEHEGVTPADGSCGRGQYLARLHGLLELVAFGLVDPVRERRVDHHDDVVEGALRHQRAHGFVELLQRWIASALGGDVRPVDNEMSFCHDVLK